MEPGITHDCSCRMQGEIGSMQSISIWIQRTAGWLFFGITGTIVLILLKWVRSYRIMDHEHHRRFFASLRRDLKRQKKPLLICANHLTMIDSVILQWAFGDLKRYLFRFGDFAWNVPAREVFASRWYLRLIIYLTKCIPIDRNGGKEHHEAVMHSIEYVLKMGDPFIIFPEGGRSRRGRFDMERLTYGIGRIMRDLPETQVLCVYLRSDRQHSYSALPPKGSTFDLEYSVIHPQTQEKGMRAERDLAIQVGEEILRLEERYFAKYPERK